MEKRKKKVTISLLEKLREAELLVLPNKPLRRTSKEVLYDKRWKPDCSLPQYLAMFFVIYQKDIIDAGHRWKDFIMNVILEREQGIEHYESLYVPADNVGTPH